MIRRFPVFFSVSTRRLLGDVPLYKPFSPRRIQKVFSSTSTSSSTTASTNSAHQWKVAIVGSGPSGCYTAKYLAASQQYSFAIDILDRLPTAYGLVRNGVAPDHPEVKNVQNDFDGLFTNESNNNKNNNIRFFGNVQVGKDVSLQELRKIYDMVVLAYGCESDRDLPLPGSELKGILSARQFVAWYNGHPDFDWVGPIVKEALKGDVVILGHGNVALDCARILAKSRDELDPTDLTTRALDILHPASSSMEENKRTISVVGRRGHVQGAFTIKELRELTKLPHADFIVRRDELDMGKSTPASQLELKDSRPRTRMDTLLMEAAKTEEKGANRQVKLRFLLNPIRFEASDKEPSTLARVLCERTQLHGEAGSQRAVGTGEEETIDAQLSLVSIGYKGVPIEGTELWFDQSQGTLKNTHGLVDRSTAELGGLYTAGWLKRGPSGIIGTNIPDAKDTVTSMLHDIASLSPKVPNDEQSHQLEVLLKERGVEYVDWDGYQRIDVAESSIQQKRHPDQPREKLTSRQELLDVARGSPE